MRVLLVGAGGVGTAHHPDRGPARRSSRRWSSPTTTRRGPRPPSPRSTADDRFLRRAGGRLRRGGGGGTAGPAPLRRAAQRHRPALRDAPVPCGARRRGRATSTWRCRCPVRTPSVRTRSAGCKLGDEQFAQAEEWAAGGRLALVGMGVEPGLSDVFARYAADELFDEIEEIGVRDGANLTVDGYDFAPSFSIWTTIEECLNPPVVYEADRGWFTTAPFSEPEVFDFPEGIGPVECVNVEHEEVLLVPRWVDARRVTFKYGLGGEFIETLKTLHPLGLDRTDAGDRAERAGPGAGLAAGRGGRLPARPGDAGRADARQDLRGHLGTGRQGRRAARGVPLPRGRQPVVDGASTARQAVVWQTAINPVVALELLATGAWSGAGVLGPEAFPARPVPRPADGVRLPVGAAGAVNVFPGSPCFSAAVPVTRSEATHPEKHIRLDRR